MPCFHPITAFQPLEGGELAWRELPDHKQLQLPCNQCVGCRLRRSAEWATRCMHEAKMHRYNSWLTLTYQDEHLPNRYDTGLTHPKTNKRIYSGTLDKHHPQKFFRALRKALSSKRARTDLTVLFEYKDGSAAMGLRPIPQLRYYYGGEYGEKYGRPHYHACLFGVDFNDKKHTATTDAGYKLYESQTLTKLWPHGQHTIGDLTWETAAYTARYIMKKITGQKQKNHYEKIDHETGEIINAMPEYNDMSRRPGIAHQWLQKYLTDVYPHDHVIVRGNKTKPPRYYDKLYQPGHELELELIKHRRQTEALKHWEDHTEERLAVQEIVTTRRIQSLKQKL